MTRTETRILPNGRTVTVEVSNDHDYFGGHCWPCTAPAAPSEPAHPADCSRCPYHPEVT